MTLGVLNASSVAMRRNSTELSLVIGSSLPSAPILPPHHFDMLGAVDGFGKDARRLIKMRAASFNR
ncbi:hypothetical protein ABH37_19320 [Mycobacterium haemophilum]|uniref:Uncharacterized protein n=1 Tax=Mycobacterium haemophilum TaxID=29311 RepID=A0A0I9T8G6_9MYCO|nr:hypothetical protein ABH39_19900 [Mycobacterium haemophilum]KLO34163.1 hypothetical protein ABH38_19685 [Mycobacterium haemophilum]KLO37028.1 hypothetical protein ABH37_19320 [Mycobacterium haemophilum]KLO43330.1 hypothetical protein ABH36_19860 [Mycobacterium haemophilum]